MADYALMSIGHKEKLLNEQRRERQLQWTILCGYKDPKKPPFRMQDWWKIEGDPILIMPSHEDIVRFNNEFKNLKKNG